MSSTTASKYVKLKDQREHILLKPDMYIGSIKADNADMYIVNEEGNKMIKKQISYIPGLFKIFDEIVANAIDHAIRLKAEGRENDKQVSNIKVNIDKESGVISVYNDGEGIEVEVHPDHDVYIPELIFSHLLTSSNYDDSKTRVVQGTNGIGCKACNIMSKWLEVETLDISRSLLYKQKFTNNMEKRLKPSIKTSKLKTPFTKVTFLPDYPRFGLEGLTDDMYEIMRKRVYDVCAVATSSKLKVSFNGNVIPYSSFQKYVDLYISEGKRIYEKVNDRWEVIVAHHDDYEQISFVNGLLTVNGGTHVKYIVDPLVKSIVGFVKTKHKLDVKPQNVKNNLIVFVSCTVDNPTFNSQSKEALTTPVSLFGSSAKLSDATIKKICASDIIEGVLSNQSAVSDKAAKKTDGKKQNIIRGLPKLEDAIWAGTAKSSMCTLILTEGDSAASMAIAGLAAIGREKYGVFPLKGKVMNVKDATAAKIADNDEIANIKKILGLESGKKYVNTDSLRYGSIMLLADQDCDGSHIKGLVINLFHTLWPSLLKDHKYITSMNTPIIKATKGQTVKNFYNLTTYENWKNDPEQSSGNWKIKYYKGLGTSTNAEAKEYFKDMKKITFVFDDINDKDCALDLAFNKKKADDRKNWLSTYDRQVVLSAETSDISCADFVNKELIHFSNYDLERSIPNVLDGLKISQRKILYSCFKRNLTKDEIRVAQLAGYVSEHSAYHHGEASLQSAIIGMAQDFVGTNNINLLLPNGQFGSRVYGGKDAGQPRYIHTLLNPITSTIFSKQDLPILNYTDDDGVAVEPKFYVPIIPMLLVNGSIGIGTGFSTNIPCFNPVDIISVLKSKLNGTKLRESQKKMIPWYKGFKGTIVQGSSNKLFSKGVYKKGPASTVVITELPVGTWTIDYKEDLEALLEKLPEFKKYENKSAESIHITLYFGSADYLSEIMAEEEANGFTKFENTFKLVSTKGLNMNNMYAFNKKGQITKYATPIDIIDDFFECRKDHYVLRKEHMLGVMKDTLEYLSNKIRFVMEIVNEKLVVHKMSHKEIDAHLKKNKYAIKNGNYDYLTKIPIYNFTIDKVKELKNEHDELKAEHDKLVGTTIETMYMNELDELNLVEQV